MFIRAFSVKSLVKFSPITIILFAICLFVLVQTGCDHGLAPVAAPPYGISGTIHFTNWPPADSIKDLRVVIFKSYPPQNIVTDVLNGKARYTDELLPYAASSINYTLTLPPLAPGTYEYLVVAQRYGTDVFNDWRVVGEYGFPADSLHPASIFIPGNEILHNINMNVDFQHLPPQPGE